MNFLQYDRLFYLKVYLAELIESTRIYNNLNLYKMLGQNCDLLNLNLCRLLLD